MEWDVIMRDGELKRKRYKKDFLKNVIVRIDYDTPLPIATSGPAKCIYDVVRKRFPITEERSIVGKELIIGPNATKERAINTIEWHYYSIDRMKHLTISPNVLVIEYSKYEYFETLREDFLSVADALFDSYPKAQIRRLGLRYIDNIEIPEGNPTEWDKYLIPELNATFTIASNREAITRAFHIMEFNYGEDLLRFQFGMFNPDYPAPIKKKLYTLDYDLYTSKLLDKSDIEETLNRFHEKANISFEEVITDDLREIMEPMHD